MGGDGGSIPRREELVRSKQRPERADRRAANEARWRHCSLNQEILRQPIVSCRLGRLYNKESVITKLLDKSKAPTTADHIKRLKDVRELNLTVNRSITEQSDPLQEGSGAFYCPVTGLEMCGTHAFVYLWSCGCVFSKKAIDTVHDSLCMLCGKPFTSDDVILINPQTEEELAAAHQRLLKYQSSTSHKAKKRSAGESHVASCSHSKQDGCSTAEVEVKSKKDKTAEDDSSSGDQTGPPDSEVKKPHKSIQEDPNASTVYKSLFNTCEEAKRQPKAAWVTYNPLYFR
ncbi:unnamed protein product [Calicophoron daubneyi]|uniref:Replication termination factor 2 n=1 Tax=Calicophoron daubneyi TaxID=300641 RepID=A0AAV2TMQ9_CALDB